MLAITAPAQPSSSKVYFDFGRHDGGVNGAPVANPVTPVGGSGSFYWNSIGEATQGQTAGQTYGLFVATDNTALTGWSLTVQGLNNQANGKLNGGLLSPTSALLGELAVPNASQDYFFTTSAGQFQLSGLSSAYSYNFTFFGTRESTAARTTTYSATGLAGTLTTSALATSGAAIGAGGYNGNNNTTVSLSGISPDNSGNITIQYTAASGGFGYLGIMGIQMIAVPEPASGALLGLGALLLVGWRRRR